MDFPFTRHGYRHVLLARSGSWCIVERTWVGDEKPHLPHFEVVRLEDRPARRLPDGSLNPGGVAYPSPRAWGRWAWSEPTLRHAIARWERLRADQPGLPTCTALGLVDDSEGWEAWKAGHL